VVVPVGGREDLLAQCLAGLEEQSAPPLEIIVVDDGCRPAMEPPRSSLALRLLRQEPRRGPAAARNRGAAEARGEILLFLDSDVVPEPEVVALVERAFRSPDAPDALFGSYVARRTDRGLVADYKDLSIAWLHHAAPREARTFWSGCGAVRADAFRAVGGFDADRYPRAMVEDVDLGLRLGDRGYVIHVHPEIQVRHLKRWTLGSLWRADIRDRAVPWSRLMHRRGLSRDLMHLQRGRKLAAIAAWTLPLALTLAIWWPELLIIAAAALLVLAIHLGPLLGFIARHGGIALAALSFPLHGLYLMYGSATFVATRLISSREAVATESAETRASSG
jgi:GT2 family glycosyltransferase